MTPPRLRRAAGHLGALLGAAARALGIGPAVTRAALSVLRRLEPGHPLLTRAAAASPSHGTDALLAEMYRDPEHPLRVAADHARAGRQAAALIPRAFVTAEQDPDWPLIAQLAPENAWHFARTRYADSVETACGLTLLLGPESTVTDAPGLIVSCVRCSSRARHPSATDRR